MSDSLDTSAAQEALEKSKLCERDKAALDWVLQKSCLLSEERLAEVLLTVSQPVRDVALFTLQRYAHCQSISC